MMMPHLHNKIHRGFRIILDGNIPRRFYSRLILVNSFAILTSWVFRIFGGETHRASIYAAEFGICAWIISTIVLIFAEIGHDIPKKESILDE